MMQDPTIRHSYVEVHSTLVHLVEYGLEDSLLKPPAQVSSNNSTDVTLSPSSNLLDKNSHTRNDKSELTTPSRETATRLIVFVPGNPGILGMYHDFLMTLFKTLNGPHGGEGRPALPILAISHNDFDHPDHVDYQAEARYYIEDEELNFAERAQANNYQADPYRVGLQVLNKLIILKRLLREDLENYKIVFVGHSIGCYVILRLLQDRLLNTAHAGSILLHPALENLALTDKGSVFNAMFRYRLDLVMRAGALIVDKLLPLPIKLVITRWKCTREYLKNSSEIAITSLSQLICNRSLKATIEMAKSEFSSIKDIDINTLIKPQVSKLKLVYAINDHWVNTEHRQKLKQICPELYMEEHPVLHAFIMNPDTVIDYSVRVAIFIQDFMNHNKD